MEQNNYPKVPLSPAFTLIACTLSNTSEAIVCATHLQEYKFRRAIFDEEGIEVPLEIIREYHRTFDHFPLKAYITEMKEQHKNSGLIIQKADELYLQVLEDE